MSHSKGKFQFKLNIFDCIIVVLGGIVACILGALLLKPDATVVPFTEQPSPIRFTIRLNEVTPETIDHIEVGDVVYDSYSNSELGSIISATVVPYTIRTYSEDTQSYIMSEDPYWDSIELVVDGFATDSDTDITLSSGFQLKCNENMAVRGPGYVGTGTTVAIEWEEVA